VNWRIVGNATVAVILGLSGAFVGSIAGFYVFAIWWPEVSHTTSNYEAAVGGIFVGGLAGPIPSLGHKRKSCLILGGVSGAMIGAIYCATWAVWIQVPFLIVSEAIAGSILGSLPGLAAGGVVGTIRQIFFRRPVGTP
jgi:hypothetical protein